MIYVGVDGTKTWFNKADVFEKLDSLNDKLGGIEVVCGGASLSPVAKFTIEWAKQRGRSVIVHFDPWDSVTDVDMLVLFIDKHDDRTKGMLDRAREHERGVLVYSEGGHVEKYRGKLYLRGEALLAEAEKIFEVKVVQPKLEVR